MGSCEQHLLHLVLQLFLFGCKQGAERTVFLDAAVQKEKTILGFDKYKITDKEKQEETTMKLITAVDQLLKKK